jgi:hypothetical protein
MQILSNRYETKADSSCSVYLFISSSPACRTRSGSSRARIAAAAAVEAGEVASLLLHLHIYRQMQSDSISLAMALHESVTRMRHHTALATMYAVCPKPVKFSKKLSSLIVSKERQKIPI